MVAVRTLTVFFNTGLYSPEESADKLRSFVESLELESLRRPFEKAGIEVYNVRLSVSPPRTAGELESLLRVFESSEFDYFGGIGTFGVNELSRKILEALEFPRLTAFVSVESLSEASEAARLVESLKDNVSAARFLVGVNPPRFSPYLPYSFVRDPAIKYALSVAINRISDLREAIDGNSHEGVKQAVFRVLPKVAYPVQEIAMRLRIPYIGLDVSLAPMPGVPEESIGSLLADLSDANGMLSYIYTLNEAIREYPLVAPLVGYNRVMTPLGEDHKLAELASRGLITLDTLKARCSVCSTGVDVVPVRPHKVRGAILDTIAIGLAKKEPMGARLIPRSRGDHVDLGEIGSAPVLRRSFFLSSSGTSAR